MIIYYSHSYNNGRDESRDLLVKAVENYILSGRAGIERAGDAAGEAVRLVSSRQITGEFGKPYIPGFAPFSISHSGNTWAVLIADPGDAAGHSCDADKRDMSCGLDIQYARKVDAPAVMKRFFAAEDAMYAGDFFRLWTRREALIKAAGTSVAESDVPAVNRDEVCYGGRLYRLKDITVPGCEAFGAICIPAAAAIDTERDPVMLELDPGPGITGP